MHSTWTVGKVSGKKDFILNKKYVVVIKSRFVFKHYKSYSTEKFPTLKNSFPSKILFELSNNADFVREKPLEQIIS